MQAREETPSSKPSLAFEVEEIDGEEDGEIVVKLAVVSSAQTNKNSLVLSVQSWTRKRQLTGLQNKKLLVFNIGIVEGKMPGEF